jgi:hypothetical protein
MLEGYLASAGGVPLRPFFAGAFAVTKTEAAREGGLRRKRDVAGDDESLGLERMG